MSSHFLKFFTFLSILFFSAHCHTMSSQPVDSADVLFSKSRGDLISLHYDHSPDPDDGHSAAADRTISDYYGLGNNVHVVSGTYSRTSTTEGNKGDYQEASEDVMKAVWGIEGRGWFNAHKDFDGTVQITVLVWKEKLLEKSEPHIWVKEGGPSDFTAAVLVKLIQDKDICEATLKNRIHVIQHGPTHPEDKKYPGFNERITGAKNLSFVKKHTDYIKIPNGNVAGNGTADLRFFPDDDKRNGTAKIKNFMAAALKHPTCGVAWSAAFAYHNPLKDKNGKADTADWPYKNSLDFSDTVEFLYIMGIDVQTISDCIDFAEFFIG